MKKKISAIACSLFIIATLTGMNNDRLNKVHQTQPDIQKSILEGKKVFSKYCISCHQADGGGVPYLNPPLIKTSYVLGIKDSLIHIILHGLSRNIEIEDEVFTNPMPALNILKDEEIANVLTYVRNSFGNKASSVMPTEVKAMRSKMK
jgi:mono/diheme cytochrome c family protein